jgi:predicted esterase
VSEALVEVGSGTPARLVVALHGYGGCGREIAAALTAAAGAVPRVLIFAPDGTAAASLAPAGRAWYPITSYAGEMAVRSRSVAAAIVPRLAAYQRRHGIEAERTCVIGFSQGTTVGAAILEQGDTCSSGVFVCGRLPRDPDRRRQRPLRGVQTLVIAGGRDRFAPPDLVRADLAAGWLGAKTRLVVLPDLAHELRPDVAALAMAFAAGRRKEPVAVPSEVARDSDVVVPRRTP